MDLYLIRHGKTVFNQEDRHQYSTTPLAEEGIAAAHKLATRLSGVHFDALYSSPMKRAQQTAEILGKTWGQEVATLDDLREQKHPSILEGRNKQEPEVVQVRAERRLHLSEPSWHHSDEENYWDVRDRVLRLRKFLLESHPTGGTILGVSHGICIKMFIATIIFGKEVTPEQFLLVYEHTITSNTGITHCQYTDEHGWQLITMNDDAHL